MTDKELGKIHDDMMQELNQYRKTLPNHPEGDDKVRIIKIIKEARTDNGNGVVSARRLSKEIEKKFGYQIGRTTISEWEKL